MQKSKILQKEKQFFTMWLFKNGNPLNTTLKKKCYNFFFIVFNNIN